MGEAISGTENLLLGLSPELTKETMLTEQPDLTLRLSLGEIYCEKSKENPLTRSSSVIGVISQDAEKWKWDMQTHTQPQPLPGSFLSLSRSRSLPAETDHLDRNKLKELQFMRRMEAKKRLVEQRNGRVAPMADSAPPSPSEVAAWAAASAAKSPALCRAIDKIKSTHGNLLHNYSVEGHGSSSSTKGSSSSQSSLESNDRELVVTSQTLATRKSEINGVSNGAKKCKLSTGLMGGSGGMDVMRMMPSVSTVGDGPNGRRVEGFLYKYMKGQVCIVCVCHGSFLSPAEFVKHAGGKEVANPMKYIHVCCSTSLSV